jgi:hypothetical protein
MSQLVSVLYICNACRKIKQLDISTDRLEKEGELYKIKDVHTDHEAILYLNSRYGLEVVTNDPPAPPSEHPVIKGLLHTEEDEPSTVAFEGATQIYLPTASGFVSRRIVTQGEIDKLILGNMDGEKTLGDLYEQLRSERPDLTPEQFIALIRDFETKGWIKEKD